MALRLMDSIGKQEPAEPVPAPVPSVPSPPEPKAEAPQSIVPPPAIEEIVPETQEEPTENPAVSEQEPGPDGTLKNSSVAVPPEKTLAPKAPKKPQGPAAARIRGKAEALPRRSIRDLPGSLVEMAVRSSGDASVSNIRAVEAFLFAHRDRSLDDQIDYSDITDEVAALAQGFDTARREKDRDRRLQRIERQLAGLDATVEKALWAVIYLVWHSTGLRTDAPVSPDEIGFSQDFDGFEATLRTLAKAVNTFSEDRARREGRPIR